MEVKVIGRNDNEGIKNVIKTVLEEHGVNKPGTAYFDESLNDMYGFYTNPNSIYFIAQQEGKIIGGAGIYPTAGLPEDTCELVKMYLLAEVRGQGFGKALIDKCLAFAKQSGYKRVYLETMSELGKAVLMYEKFGFKVLDGPLGNTGHFACTIRMIKNI